MKIINLLRTYADSPIDFSYGFQDPATQWMLGTATQWMFGIVFSLIMILTIWFLIILLIKLDRKLVAKSIFTGILYAKIKILFIHFYIKKVQQPIYAEGILESISSYANVAKHGLLNPISAPFQLLSNVTSND